MWSLFILLPLVPCLCYHQWQTIYHRVTQEPEFSGFNSIIKSHRKATLNLYYSSLTVFVPVNDAIDEFDADFSESLVLYHMAVGAKTLKLLAQNSTMQSMHANNPPLWITVSDGYYVNNIKIIESRSNYAAKGQGDQNINQVLHVIDGVLDHAMVVPQANPTAYDFLLYHHQWRIKPHNVNSFLDKIQLYHMQKWYNGNASHTFFIPVDKMHQQKLETIDGDIVHAHVVPNQVLFTTPTEKNYVYETAANDDYLCVVVCFTTINQKNYVRSYTVTSNSNHKKGEVLAEIIKSDIPVTNGVVHLISQPLAVFDRKLKLFPYLPVAYKIASDPTLNITFNVGQLTINKLLTRPNLFTYFAPRDEAWGNMSTGNIQQLQGILRRHLLLDERFNMAQLVAMSPVTLKTVGGDIDVTVIHANDSYYVEWNSTLVRVYRADYKCSDGVVHVMDGLFGVAPITNALTQTGFWSAIKNLFT